MQNNLPLSSALYFCLHIICVLFIEHVDNIVSKAFSLRAEGSRIVVQFVPETRDYSLFGRVRTVS